MPTLIYCSGGTKKFSAVAVAAGFHYGARLPSSVYWPLYFSDQDWKKPNRTAYVAAVARHRPTLATVLDWERMEQLPEVLGWAEDVAPFVESVLIVPKVIGGIGQLPRVIGGKPVRLAYAVGSNFGCTQVPVWEFGGWPVHLLGGTPEKQMRIWHYMDVRSVDGNLIQRVARTWCKYWVPAGQADPGHKHWRSLRTEDGSKWGHDAIYEAFRRSCVNVLAAWSRLCGKQIEVPSA